MLFSQELFHLEYLFLTPFDTFDTCYYFGLNLNLMLLIKGGRGNGHIQSLAILIFVCTDFFAHKMVLFVHSSR